MQNPDKLGNETRLPLTIRIFTSLLRLFFNLLYHEFGWAYDGVAWLVSLGAWEKWVLSALPYLDGPRTLEIGFGPGHLQEALNRKEVTSFGLDESRQMGQITRRRLARLGYHSNLVRGNALALPFAGRSIHQVVMTFPSEYIFNPVALAEIHRVLIDGGMAVILPLAWVTGRKPFERAVAWLTSITGESPEWHEESLEPLKKAGFKVDWEMIDLTSSKILIVRMVKLPTSDMGLQSS